MTTAVTGATGFLGRQLTRLLLEREETVRVLARPTADVREFVAAGAAIVEGDITDPKAVQQAVAEAGLVYHLAGVVAHEQSDRERLEATNVGGVRNVLSALPSDARLVHVSSVAAIGPAPDPEHPADESQPFPAIASRYPYAATKNAGERLVLDACDRIDAVVANPGFLIGPEDVTEVSTWPVKRYLQGVLRLHIPGGLSYVDARDAAAGLLQVAASGRRGERYVLSAPDGNITHEDFFKRLGRVTGVRRKMLGVSPQMAVAVTTLVPWPVRPGEVRAGGHYWWYRTDKAARELGFATRSVDETLAATAAQYIGI